MSCSMDVYPTTDDISGINQELIPPLLKLFIESLIKSKVKQSSLAQALIQAARPQSAIIPLLFGLGVQLDHEFDSEFLLMQLSRLGFCVSYDEVTRFKCSVMQSGHADVLNCATSASAFTQFIADSVDHSVRTLDGLHTFHGMGIIAASVMNDASSAMLVGNRHIPCLQTRLKVSNVCRKRSIIVVSYDLKSGSGLTNVMLSNIW